MLTQPVNGIELQKTFPRKFFPHDTQIFSTDGKGLVLLKIVTTRHVHDLRVIFFGGSEKFFQRVRQNEVVAVHEVNIFSA